MEHAGRQKAGGAGLRALDEMPQGSDSARGDHRQPHRAAHGTQQIEIEAETGAVAVHAGQQDLAGAKLSHAAAPVDSVDPGGPAAAMSEDLPSAWLGLLGVDRNDDTLAAEFLGRLAHEVRPRHGGRVDAALVGAGEQQAAHVFG